MNALIIKFTMSRGIAHNTPYRPAYSKFTMRRGLGVIFLILPLIVNFTMSRRLAERSGPCAAVLLLVSISTMNTTITNPLAPLDS